MTKAKKKYPFEISDMGETAYNNLQDYKEKWKHKTNTKAIIEILEQVPKIAALYDEVLQEYSAELEKNQLLKHTVTNYMRNKALQIELEKSLNKLLQ